MANKKELVAQAPNQNEFFKALFAKQLETQESRYYQANPRINQQQRGNPPKFELKGKDDQAELNVVLAGVVTASEYRDPATDNDIPDCSSIGGVNGTRFGACASCPHGEWHDGANGKRFRECKQHEKLCVIIADENDPVAYELRVTPASRPNFNAYHKAITKDGKAMSSIVTNLSLEGVKEGKLSFSRITFKQGKSIFEADPKGEFELLKRLQGAIENLPKFFATTTPKNGSPDEETESQPRSKTITVTEEEAQPSAGLKIEVMDAEDGEEDAVPF